MFEDTTRPQRQPSRPYNFTEQELPGDRIVDYFSALIALTLRLRASGVGSVAAGLRERINRLLDQAESQALRAGKASSDVSDAMFAVVAFIDETIQGSDWPGKSQWLMNPLQTVRFGRSDAGEEFFRRLESVRMDPRRNAEVLEVCYLTLALGFKGKYQLHGAHDLRRLIDEVHSDLQTSESFRFKTLSPNGRPRDQITAEVRTKMPMWAVLLSVFLTAVVAYMICGAIVSEAASDAEIKINSAIVQAR
jgi:type VI secretion system protein ImpK